MSNGSELTVARLLMPSSRQPKGKGRTLTPRKGVGELSQEPSVNWRQQLRWEPETSFGAGWTARR